MENEFICESESPVCSGLTAAVIRDENAYYFGLMDDYGGGVTFMLWLCNRREAPEDWEPDRAGSFVLPRRFVGHDPAGMELDEDSLRIVWYAAGDCAAVFDKDGLLGAIPPYAVMGECTGYSRYLRERCRYGWPLTEHDAESVLSWLRFADKQWNAIRSEETWDRIDSAYREIYAQFAGQPEHYLHLQNNAQPYRRLWMSRKAGICYNLTVGMAQLELPYVWHVYGKDWMPHARMELGFACKEECADAAGRMVPVMDTVIRLPWDERDYLGHGHTIDIDPAALPGYTGLLVLDAAQIKGMPCPPLPQILGSPTRLHWLVPLKAQEMQQIRSDNEKGLKKFLRSVWFPEAVHIFNG